jgi:hypothetical protein
MASLPSQLGALSSNSSTTTKKNQKKTVTKHLKTQKTLPIINRPLEILAFHHQPRTAFSSSSYQDRNPHLISSFRLNQSVHI